MTLHNLSLLLTIALILVLLLVFLYVAVGSGIVRNYESIQARGLSFRSKLFWALVVLGVIVTAATLQRLPYPSHAGVSPTVIDVVGHQWYWTLSQTEVRAGEPVVFKVTSADVNHGMGLYDSGLVLLAQTQAMPDYVNRLEYTFEKPGAYKILCLELCGLAHHAMVAELTVVAQAQ